MSFECCVFMDCFEDTEGVVSIHVDSFADINENIKQCKNMTVLERMSGKKQKKELVIHPCVTTEKGFWVFLERLLKNNPKIDIKVLVTEGLPKIFQNRCKIIKKEAETYQDNNNKINTRWKINKYIRSKANESYIMAFVTSEKYKFLLCK